MSRLRKPFHRLSTFNQRGGWTITELRRELGKVKPGREGPMSQTEFGKMLGASLSTVNRWEGLDTLPALVVRAIAGALLEHGHEQLARDWLTATLGEVTQ